MSAAPVCDPDWNGIWKERQRLQEASKIAGDSSHNWNRKENAERYDANARSEYDDRVQRPIAALPGAKDARGGEGSAGEHEQRDVVVGPPTRAGLAVPDDERLRPWR